MCGPGFDDYSRRKAAAPTQEELTALRQGVSQLALAGKLGTSAGSDAIYALRKAENLVPQSAS